MKEIESFQAFSDEVYTNSDAKKSLKNHLWKPQTHTLYLVFPQWVSPNLKWI